MVAGFGEIYCHNFQGRINKSERTVARFSYPGIGS
jgi:hypothetical protein